ncbi:MAG TPA: hypothetical protein G4O14_13010 [Anaerolineae bacterium]|nr:hypothetical protein [Anaerolineae bacterium]
MRSVRLIHWNAAEAEACVQLLADLGYEVVFEVFNANELRNLRETPPNAFIIDLSRLPSQGRDLGISLRKYKTTRHVPLLFVGGETKKVGRIKEILPDAIYTSWDGIGGALKQAISKPLEDPVVPGSLFEAYSGVQLPKKLGIMPDTVVALVSAPENFENTLGELPAGVTLRKQNRGQRDLTLWFPKSRAELDHHLERMSTYAEGGGLWIIWPKKSSGVVSDLSQTVVRKSGLDAGLVDFKICSIDKTWSGLRFTQRKSQSD